MKIFFKGYASSLIRKKAQKSRVLIDIDYLTEKKQGRKIDFCRKIDQ